MKKASAYDSEKLQQLKAAFETSLAACLKIFGKDEVFTDISKERNRQGVVYFDLLMNTLWKTDGQTLVNKREKIRAAFIELCQSDAFRKSTAGGIQRKSSINRRNVDWNAKLQEAIDA